MTYEPTVTGPDGLPISGLLVTVNNEMNGRTIQRTTDGGGYANVALVGFEPSDRITISILDPEYRFKGYVAGDAMTAKQADGKFSVVLLPFERASSSHVVRPTPEQAAVLKMLPRRGASLYGQFGDRGWDGEEFARIIADCGMTLTRWWAWGGWVLNDASASRMPFTQRSDGVFDLFAWNQRYFDDAVQRTAYNNTLGILVQWTIMDLYSWSDRKQSLPGIPDQSVGPFRNNSNGVHWEHDDTFDRLPDQWLTEFVERLVGALKGLGVIYEIGNEMPEKPMHLRIRNVIKAVDPSAVVTVSRNSDSPGQYANMAIGRDFDLISFHGWKDLARLNEHWTEEATTGRPDSYRALLESGVDTARIIACSDGARSNSSNQPYDLPRLLEAFRFAVQHGCSVEHQSQAKMRLFNDGVHTLDTVEIEFLKQIAAL